MIFSFHLQDYYLLWSNFPVMFNYDTFTLCSVRNPRDKSLVWALSFSLAATKKIDFSFSSSRYLDVSVPQVYPYIAIYSLYNTWGFPCEFPHSEIFGSLVMCTYPKLIAAYHVLHRLLMPRHSPCALCSLTYSNFIFMKLSLQRIFLGLLYLYKQFTMCNFQRTCYVLPNL